MTIETARALIPAGSHVEMEKLLELGLDKDSLVVVVGSYKGLTTRIIHEAYGCRMMCYDPQVEMCEILRELHLDNVEVFAYGLGEKSGSFQMWEMGNNAASFFDANSTRDPNMGTVRDVAEVLKDLDIDLLFINCEGSEFQILDRMYEAGIMNARMLMVQFHLAVTFGNSENYERHVDRLKEDYAVIWTIGAPWTLFERYDYAIDPPAPGEKSAVTADDDEEKPACPECDFRPEPDKDYTKSMAGHKAKHTK